MYSPPEPTPIPHRRRMRPITILGIVLAVVVIVCGGGIVAIGLLSAGYDRAPVMVAPTYPPFSPSPTGSTRPKASSTPAAAAPSRTASQPPPPPARIVIEDGTWTIGEDFPARKYMTNAAPSTCYWEITKSGTNGADIISNGLGPGNLRVTLKAGQDFSSDDCGTW